MPWSAARQSFLKLMSISSSQKCHPTISSSVIPFSCLQSFPASVSFPMSQLFASGGQSIEASASASVRPVNIQNWFPLRLTSLTLQSMGLTSVLQHHGSKTSVLQCSAFFMVQLSHPYMTTGKTIALTIWTCIDKVMSLTKQCLCFLMPYTQIIDLWFLKVVNVALI